ncbi:MAG: DNA/RNA non-specific endonuclease [Methylobacter sp.]
MQTQMKPVLSLLLFLTSSVVIADPSQCALSYQNGIAPKILNEKMTSNTQAVCYEGYAVTFSGISRTPLWAAEHLTKDRIGDACQLKRSGIFHPDPNLPVGMRSELSDYARSGYDRGHMAPSADMPTLSAQNESFSLANMVPQRHANNAGIWEKLETSARNLALGQHDIYVVSGPLFEGDKIQQLKGRVMIPTSIFKAVYDATANRAAVYITPNTSEQVYTVQSVEEAAARLGIDPFPGLSEEARKSGEDVMKPAKRTLCPARI